MFKFLLFISLLNLGSTFISVNNLKYSLLMNYDRDNIPKQNGPLNLTLEMVLSSVNNIDHLDGILFIDHLSALKKALKVFKALCVVIMMICQKRLFIWLVRLMKRLKRAKNFLLKLPEIQQAELNDSLQQ